MTDLLKEKVFWTGKMNLKLVKFMKLNRHIWDPKHPKYTSMSHREHTYAEFVRKYGHQFSSRAVKDRWTNIRTTFSSYVRKCNIHNKEEPLTINWPLWDACQFLLKIKENRHCQQFKSEDEGDESNDYQDSPQGECEDLEPRKQSPDPTKLSITFQDCGDSHEEYEDVEPSKRSSDPTKLSCQNIANSIMATFQNMQNDAFGLNNTRNGDVGRKVSEKLSQMQSYDAAKLSLKIMEILVKYDPNNPDTSDDFSFYDE